MNIHTLLYYNSWCLFTLRAGRKSIELYKKQDTYNIYQSVQL